ncbi:acyl-CoA synthetase, partial [Mycobacterium sp. ITM-2017-0098]
MGITDPINNVFGLLSTMVRAGVIAPLRPDKYLRIVTAMQRENMAITSGFAAAAQRCPDRAGLVDELGIL